MTCNRRHQLLITFVALRYQQNITVPYCIVIVKQRQDGVGCRYACLTGQYGLVSFMVKLRKHILTDQAIPSDMHVTESIFILSMFAVHS